MSDYHNIRKLKLHEIMHLYTGEKGVVFVMRVLGGLIYSWDSQTIFVQTSNFVKQDYDF